MEDVLEKNNPICRLIPKFHRPNLPSFTSEKIKLPDMDPWELPGMPPDKEAGKKREKYFLADNPDESPRAPHGFWRARSLGYGIRDERDVLCLAGTKRTYDFHTGDPSRGGTKTNWVMNVYLLVGQDRFIQGDVALCHVFENNSPDYDPRPKCAACHQPPNGKGSLSSAYPCSYQHSGEPCTHPVSDQTLHPKYTSYLEEFTKLLLDDDEPDTSTDTGSYDARGGGPRSTVIASGESGQSRKRTRTSPVWERFTKIFAHGPDGVVVTFAVCNHCCKILKGDSKNGTSHLTRHKCQCNH